MFLSHPPLRAPVRVLPRASVRSVARPLKQGSAVGAGRDASASPTLTATRRSAAKLSWLRLALAALMLASVHSAFIRPACAARPRVYAIRDARIVITPQRVLESGTVVIREGTIEAVGAGVVPPADAEIIEGKGLTVYAGLIDPFTRLGMPKETDETQAPREKPTPLERPKERGPGRSNVQVRSDVRAALLYQTPPPAELEKMRSLGFTSAVVVPEGGVFRGTSALVHLGDQDPARTIMIPDIAAHLAFETGRGDVYPSSLMGVIALVRQSFEDARRQKAWRDRWRKSPKGLERPPVSPTLDAIGEILHGQRIVVEADDTHAFGRIAALAKECSFSPVIMGNGYEYEIEQQVKRSGYTLLLPVAFPQPPHVEDADAALDVTTRDLRRWNLAPWNPVVLHESAIPFAFTTYRLRSMGDFLKNVRKAIEMGLPEAAALEAVTTVPARVLGVDSLLGTVEAGKVADLVLADGPFFAEKTKIKRIFIDGEPYDLEEESKDFDPSAKIDPRGSWELTYSFGGRIVVRSWKIEGSTGSYSGTAETQGGKVSLESLTLTGNKLTGSYAAEKLGMVEFTWIIKGEDMSGSSILPDGGKVSYSGKRVAKPEGGSL